MKTIAHNGDYQLTQYSNDFICLDIVNKSIGMTLEVFDSVSNALHGFQKRIEEDGEKYIYKVVSENDDRLETEYFNNIPELLNKYETIGIVRNDHNRKELQGQPKLKNLYGAMYDGMQNGKHVIRYETQKTYFSLSN